MVFGFASSMPRPLPPMMVNQKVVAIGATNESRMMIERIDRPRTHPGDEHRHQRSVAEEPAPEEHGPPAEPAGFAEQAGVAAIQRHVEEAREAEPQPVEPAADDEQPRSGDEHEVEKDDGQDDVDPAEQLDARSMPDTADVV